MLLTEWSWDDAIAVSYEEGIERGSINIAKKALSEGASIDFIQKITGLN